MVKPTSENVPKQMQATFDAIVALTDPFCKEMLTDEYADLCRKLAAALCRKRPSPLMSGNLSTWAGAIVYAIGSVNFLFDKSQTPYLNATDLAAGFGLAKNTVANKAKSVKDALKIRPYDWHWSLPSRLADHPFAWMIEVNGLILDARYIPRELQEAAFRKGYIPYVPSSENTSR